ncbi:polyphosphate kinase [Cellulomonas sp. A375-1]|nr:polyphosphate kinase [Cellulomonas sp. A375-1]
MTDLDAASTPSFDDGRKTGEKLLGTIGERMSELQERLYAHGRSGGDRSVLLVLQGLDTAGKGGIARHVLGLVDPQGVALKAFGRPTPEELEHDFLWRIRKALPPAGRIGLFDRSHYEDILVPHATGTADADELTARFAAIEQFERELVAGGTTVVKVALWVSRDEQYLRLRERLERPDKHWKYSPNDVDVRLARPAYEAAYDEVLARSSFDVAPWYVVPADRKWYARLATSALLLRALLDLDLDWPDPSYDVATELARLDATR